MQFGITTSKIDEIGLIARAENLGYDFCWVTDSQMIRSNPWAVLALAAQQTRSIRIGTGVAVAGLRLAPVTANGIATIKANSDDLSFIIVFSRLNKLYFYYYLLISQHPLLGFLHPLVAF